MAIYAANVMEITLAEIRFFSIIYNVYCYLHLKMVMSIRASITKY